jgi:hypothetical protein
MRNRIINGAMVIDQRSAGALYTPTGGAITYGAIDRYSYAASQASKFTVQQNAGSVTPPNGFKNYLGITSLSAYSVGASEQFNILQVVEGFNIADLGFGTADAKTVTLSFWVRSSLTGTFGGVLNNEGKARSYPFTYTISSANTWTQISVTIAGDTTGTWNSTNGAGLYVTFGLGNGSTVSGTAGSWSANQYFGATGATSVVGTNGATFYITGVQLEVGTQATSFEYRQYTNEFQLCQRYCLKTPVNTAVCAVAGGYGSAQYPVTMRTAPTITLTLGAGTASAITATPDGFQANFTNVTGFGYLATSEL